MAIRASGQKHAILIEQSPAHGVTRIDVLGDGVFHEIAGRDNRYFASSHISLVDDAAHTAPVVTVRRNV